MIHCAGKPSNGYQTCSRCNLVVAVPGLSLWETGVSVERLKFGPNVSWVVVKEAPNCQGVEGDASAQYLKKTSPGER